LDLNGNVGGPLFNDINSRDMLDLRSRGRESNQSDASLDVRITDTSQLSTSDYELTFTSDTEFTVRRVSDNRVLGPFDLNAAEGEPGYAVFDGLDLTGQSGNFLSGDRYLLTPTRSAAQSLSVVMTEPQQLAFASPLAAQASLDNRGTGNVSQPLLTDGPQPLDLARLQALGVEFSYADNGDGTGVLTSTSPPLSI